jgi:hypothetical protein
VAEISGPWDGTDTGDAVGTAPYDLKTDLAEVLITNGPAAKNASLSGVSAEDNQLAATSGVNEVTIDTGKAMVYGTRYNNTAPVDWTIPTPSGSTRVDTIVLRKEWNGQLVRQQRVVGTEGAGAPAIVQTAGDTWEFPLYDVSITTGGVITLTDRREFLSVVEPDERLQLIVKGADQSKSATTINDDTHLRAPILLGKSYKFRLMIVFTESVSGTDLSIDLDVPGSSELMAFVYGLDASDAFAIKPLLSTDDWGAAATIRAIFVEGVVVPDGDGELVLQWGVSVNTGGNLTVKENSSLLLVSNE